LTGYIETFITPDNNNSGGVAAKNDGLLDFGVREERRHLGLWRPMCTYQAGIAAGGWLGYQRRRRMGRRMEIDRLYKGIHTFLILFLYLFYSIT
jgi:hypothetical protein